MPELFDYLIMNYNMSFKCSKLMENPTIYFTFFSFWQK